MDKVSQFNLAIRIFNRKLTLYNKFGSSNFNEHLETRNEVWGSRVDGYLFVCFCFCFCIFPPSLSPLLRQSWPSSRIIWLLQLILILKIMHKLWHNQILSLKINTICGATIPSLSRQMSLCLSSTSMLHPLYRYNSQN